MFNDAVFMHIHARDETTSNTLCFIKGFTTFTVFTYTQASSDEDDRLRTVHPSTCPCGQRTKILGSNRPSHGQIRTTDQDNNFEMDEWTDF